MKRSFEALAGFLFRSQVFPHGAVLLTGHRHRAARLVHAAAG